MVVATSDSAKVLPGWLAVWLALLGAAGAAAADRAGGAVGGAVADAWIDGRLETTYALNAYLGPFDIHTAVHDGVVRLSGKVADNVQRDLAVTIAKQLDGVREVEDQLVVDSHGAGAVRLRSRDAQHRSFSQMVDDATDTARVRSNLLSNGNTRGLSIDVATEDAVVTLKGRVPSRKAKMLAEMIARNTDGIANVRNQLEINEQTQNRPRTSMESPLL